MASPHSACRAPHGYDALHYGELRRAQGAHKGEFTAEKPSRNIGETGVTNRKYPSNKDEINAAKHPCAFAIVRSASLPPNRAALVSSGPQAWNRNAAHASTRTARTACLATTTRTLPSALPLAPACTRATSSPSIGGKPRNFAFCDAPLLTPPIQEKTNPQVGLFFIACKWALRV